VPENPMSESSTAKLGGLLLGEDYAA
jgi:hypothetical protein